MNTSSNQINNEFIESSVSRNFLLNSQNIQPNSLPQEKQNYYKQTISDLLLKIQQLNFELQVYQKNQEDLNQPNKKKVTFDIDPKNNPLIHSYIDRNWILNSEKVPSSKPTNNNNNSTEQLVESLFIKNWILESQKKDIKNQSEKINQVEKQFQHFNNLQQEYEDKYKEDKNLIDSLYSKNWILESQKQQTQIQVVRELLREDNKDLVNSLYFKNWILESEKAKEKEIQQIVVVKEIVQQDNNKNLVDSLFIKNWILQSEKNQNFENQNTDNYKQILDSYLASDWLSQNFQKKNQFDFIEDPQQDYDLINSLLIKNWMLYSEINNLINFYEMKINELMQNKQTNEIPEVITIKHPPSEIPKSPKEQIKFHEPIIYQDDSNLEYILNEMIQINTDLKVFFNQNEFNLVYEQDINLLSKNQQHENQMTQYLLIQLALLSKAIYFLMGKFNKQTGEIQATEIIYNEQSGIDYGLIISEKNIYIQQLLYQINILREKLAKYQANEPSVSILSDFRDEYTELKEFSRYYVNKPEFSFASTSASSSSYENVQICEKCQCPQV